MFSFSDIFNHNTYLARFQSKPYILQQAVFSPLHSAKQFGIMDVIKWCRRASARVHKRAKRGLLCSNPYC